MFGNWSKRRKVVKDAENYLKATDVVSRPMAILMSAVLIIIVAALLFGVFLGGRWAYRKIKGDEAPVAVTTQGIDGPGSSADTENQQQEFPPLTDSTTPAPFTTTAPAASTSIANTGPEPTAIPNTGPDESQP